MNKKAIIIPIIVFFCYPVWGQLLRDRWGDVIPYSVSEKYSGTIDHSDIPFLEIKPYNNDSLFYVMNNGKTKSELGSCFASGILIDTLINLREYGLKTYIDEGVLWSYIIRSSTAAALGAAIEAFDIPEGGYLSYIPIIKNKNAPDSYIMTYDTTDYDRIKSPFLRECFCNEVLIEYFEPNESISDKPINLFKVVYSFDNGFAHNVDSKSGGHQPDNVESLPCQIDACELETEDIFEQTNSIVYLEIKFWYNNIHYTSQATGFFINKFGDYDGNDKPYFVSVGHILYPELEGYGRVDISTTYSDDQVFIYTKYMDPSPNYIFDVYGKWIGGVSKKELGFGYNYNNKDYASYDFSLWQTDRDVDRLNNNGIKYAGWEYPS